MRKINLEESTCTMNLDDNYPFENGSDIQDQNQTPQADSYGGPPSESIPQSPVPDIAEDSVSADSPLAQEESYDTGATPPPKKSKTGLIAGVAAAVVALVVILVFVLGRGGGAMPPGAQNPGYMDTVIANTFGPVGDTTGYLPDFTKFGDDLIDVDFSLTPNQQLLPYELAMLGDITIGGNFAMDMGREKILLGLDVTAGSYTAIGNKFLFTPDQLAISMPMLFTRSEYISMNPATFSEDFRGSIFSQSYYGDPSDLDLQGQLDAIFGESENNPAVDAAEKYQATIQTLYKRLNEGATMSGGGKSTVNVGGTDREVYILKYSYDPAEIKSSYLEMMDALREYVDSLSDALADPAMLNELRSIADSASEAMNMLESKDKIDLLYYISEDQLLYRVEIPDYKIIVRNGSANSTGIMSFVMDLAGESCPADSMDAKLFVKDSGESIEVMHITFDRTMQGGTGKYDLALDVKDDTGSSDAMRIELNTSWNSAITESENMSIYFLYKYGFNEFGFNLTGNVTEDANQVSFADCSLSITNDGVQQNIASLSFGVRNIDEIAEEATPQNSVNFSEITLADLEAAMRYLGLY